MWRKLNHPRQSRGFTIINYRHLIIGGGMTAYAAINGIRIIDPDISIGLISAEIYPPYKRPPPSKGLWQGKAMEKIWYPIENVKINLHLGEVR